MEDEVNVAAGNEVYQTLLKEVQAKAIKHGDELRLIFLRFPKLRVRHVMFLVSLYVSTIASTVFPPEASKIAFLRVLYSDICNEARKALLSGCDILVVDNEQSGHG